jgi:hypothetical protein
MCFALGASMGELEALTSVTFAELANFDPQDVQGRISEAKRQPYALREVLYLGIEAKLWSLSVRGTGWDPLLIQILSDRAHLLRLLGRFDELRLPARRAMALSLANRSVDLAVHAIVALSDELRRSGGDPGHRVRSLGVWVGRLQDPVAKAWMLSEQAMALAEANEVKAAVRTAESAIGLAKLNPVDPNDRCEEINRGLDLAKVYAIVGELERSAEAIPGYPFVELCYGRMMSSMALGRNPEATDLEQFLQPSAQDPNGETFLSQERSLRLRKALVLFERGRAVIWDGV